MTMRSRLPRLIVAAVLAAGLSSPAAFGQVKHVAKPPAKASAPKIKPPPPPPPPEPYVPPEQVKTSDEVKRESVGGAVTAPLRDLNVVRTQIPDVLLQTLSAPYQRPPAKWKCPQLIALIRPLDDALGPDLDRLPAGDENLMDRGRQTALGTAADLASGAIPFRGVVRKISGAESHDRLVQSAIIAGNVRRAYLKGLGEAKGCSPPATPSHERDGALPVVEKRKWYKPKFRTRDSDAPQTSAESAPAHPPKSQP